MSRRKVSLDARFLVVSSIEYYNNYYTLDILNAFAYYIILYRTSRSVNRHRNLRSIDYHRNPRNVNAGKDTRGVMQLVNNKPTIVRRLKLFPSHPKHKSDSVIY